MNIFEEYKDKIISIIKKAEKDKLLIISDNLNSVNVDSTPPKIDFDISTNVSMVLAKPNNKSPNDLAQILIKLLKNEDKNLSSFSLKIAEKDGSLKWSGSVVSNEDNIIRDTLAQNGTRVITFTPILKWSMFPLVDILNDLLEMGKDSLGCEVEIEFAVNIFEDENKSPEFSLLQIKPMVMGGSRELINMDNESSKSILCNSKVTLGDGFIDNVQHIVFVDPKKFRAANTKTIAKEIHQINNAMLNKSPYILVGPGRWGSADPWLGIPVNWEHISGASAIVEIGINDFPVDPSFGSHFFQNVTSMRIGYFTIQKIIFFLQKYIPNLLIN